MKTKSKKDLEGQGLIEMVVAIAVIVVVATGLLVAVTVALRNVDFAKKKALASICTQEAIERVRYERENRNWRDETESCFYTFFVGAGGEGKIFGLNDSETWSEGEPSAPNYGDGSFIREVQFEDVGDELVQTTATCSWTDGTGEHKSEANTYFSDWD